MDKIDEIRDRMRTVPFGNSAFQILHFNDNESPERKCRHVLLQLNQKLAALQECQFNRDRTQVDIDEIQEKLKTSEGFEHRRLSIDLAEKLCRLRDQEKLIEDAKIECEVYSRVLEDLPKFTRLEFEQAERGYWEQRLTRDAIHDCVATGRVGVGTSRALQQIGLTPKLVSERVAQTLGAPNPPPAIEAGQ